VDPKAGLDGCGKSRPHRDFFFLKYYIYSFYSFVDYSFIWSDPRTVQSVASRCTDCAIPAHKSSYSSTLSLTSAVDVSRWSTPHHRCSTPEKETQYPFYRRLDGLEARSGRMQKVSPPTDFAYRTVQPVTSRYTNYVIPAYLTAEAFSQYQNCPSQKLYHRSACEDIPAVA
jgi:hypothetical protein